MTDERGTCKHCKRQNLRLTEKGLIWPHRNKADEVCPPDTPYVNTVALPDYYQAEERPRKGRKEKR